MSCRNYITEQPLNINPCVPERFQIKINDPETKPCSLHLEVPIVLVNATTAEQRKQSRLSHKRKQSLSKNLGIRGKVPGCGVATGGQQGNTVISCWAVHNRYSPARSSLPRDRGLWSREGTPGAVGELGRAPRPRGGEGCASS